MVILSFQFETCKYNDDTQFQILNTIPDLKYNSIFVEIINNVNIQRSS